MKIIREELSLEEREAQYEEYLDQHISGVQKSYEDIIRPWLVTEGDILLDKWIDAETVTEMDRRIATHDQSKWDEEEYVPYLDHFYPADGRENPDDGDESPEYQLAWLHHQHSNPHHWQHWLLLNDSSHMEDKSDRIIALEMDMYSVVEMLCDWSSFQYYRPGSTANQWYKDHGHEMIFHENTRDIIERILEKFPEL